MVKKSVCSEIAPKRPVGRPKKTAAKSVGRPAKPTKAAAEKAASRKSGAKAKATAGAKGAATASKKEEKKKTTSITTGAKSKTASAKKNGVKKTVAKKTVKGSKAGGATTAKIMGRKSTAASAMKTKTSSTSSNKEGGKDTKKKAATGAKTKGKGGKQTTAAASKGKGKGKKKQVVQRRKLTEEEREQRAKEKAERLAKRDRQYVKNWEGNSDSEGSVDTGALEENVCFDCGVVTTDEPDWDSLVLCDGCNGDYHLKCVGLDIVPRKGWMCPRCKHDEYSFEGLRYMVYKPDIYDVAALHKNQVVRKVEQDGFSLPKPKRDFTVEQCFSPARPLEFAWQEMLEKGFMCVQKVFPHDVLKRLTHGPIERKTLSGRAGNVWKGALREVETKLNGGSCSNMIDRDGRYDLRLPEFVIEELGLHRLLEPILTRLTGIMGNPAPQIRTQNVVFVPVGSPAQPWHADDSVHDLKHHRYFTILIHLNPIDENCGGTEIWSKKAQRGDMIRNRPGDAFIFHGSLQHRGQANVGYNHRLFYYASFACRQDQNIGF